MRRLSRSALVALVALLAFTACGLDRPEVARVGDRDVATADLEHAVSLQRALADLQGAPCGQPAAGESQDAACERAVLSGELLWLAVQGYAERNELGPSAGEVERAVGQLETQVGAEVLNEALSSRSVTRDDLSELGRRILTIRAVRTAVAEEQVGGEELHRLYDEGVLDFTVVDAIHILVASEAEARDVYRRVRHATQEEFMDVARRVSTEPGADESGGALGAAAASGYAEPFARAAIALDPGEVSEPVQTQFGWHVIYLVDESVTPYEEAKEGLLEPLADREFQSWLAARAAELDIQVNPRYGHFVARTFTLTATRSTDPEADAVAPSPST
jgi:peptidyl-prolyl cis-trans isomerase C